MHNLELAALTLGDNPQQLMGRLLDAKKSLRWDYARYFSESMFSFEQKRLVGSWGYYLQWQTREHPQEPISSVNPQSEWGYVLLCRVVPDAVVGVNGRGLNQVIEATSHVHP